MAVGEGDLGFVEVIDEVFVLGEKMVSGYAAGNVLVADFSIDLG